MLDGEWKSVGNIGENLTLRLADGKTFINFVCFECKAADIKLERK